ncbi:hypothetical protein BD410DRAFT_790510 [Rickenella mellea]|uniref:DUF6534 domain-containing protein n=1 Tax=Rickenella mellea TaxID=50990 RepID=A0A4Y7Q0Z4_9AGAM|nr:hypothetical protein BD410DRAFT_790510 [Rickenella mellea]
MAPSLPPIDPTIKNLLGNSYWGFVCSAVLCGVSVIQGYLYFTRNNDKLGFNLFVGCLLGLDISTTSVWAYILYRLLILNIRNSNTLAISNTYFTADSSMTLVITLFTQIFFAHQVYLVMTKRRVVVPAVITFFAILGFVSGAIRISTVRHAPGKWSRYKLSTTLEGLFFAFSDITASAAMCFLFASAAKESKRLSSALKSLTIYTVNRGILVTSAQILLVALYLWQPTKFYWSPFHITLSKLYVNTLLAMLNSRPSLRSKAGINNDGGTTLQGVDHLTRGDSHEVSETKHSDGGHV